MLVEAMGKRSFAIAILLLTLTEIEVLCTEHSYDNSSPCKVSSDTSGREGENTNITKSENDNREYKYLTLKNKLRLLLVSDPEVEKSAAAVSVNAGFANDPIEIPGLAHFLEHMLFMGTSKYPNEGEFDRFLGQHGGMSNAYTAHAHTVYFMNVKSDALPTALDRFAQFFISPLFNKNSTDREMHAVEQEFQNAYLDDGRRMDYVDRANSKPGHKYANFGAGNLETLKHDEIRNMLLDFYKTYYSSNIMTAVVLGKESIKDLEKMAVPLFDKVTNRNTVLRPYEFPYGDNELGILLKIPTVQEKNRLELKFQFPDYLCLYESMPWVYITRLMEYEGKGSLSSLVKEKGWAHSLSAGDGEALPGFQIFVISVELTKEGLKHVDDITTLIFQYIKMLRNECGTPMRWIHDEMKDVDAINFRFQDKEDPVSYVVTLVTNMHFVSSQHVLNARYVTGKFMPREIGNILSYFTPEKARYIIASKTVEGPMNMRAKYFNFNYTMERVPTVKIQKWMNVSVHEKLRLPSKNPFVADLDDLDIVVSRRNKTRKNVPVILKDNKISRVWYKADDTFYLPKSTISIVISSPHASLTPSHSNHLKMFEKMLEEAIIEFGYYTKAANMRHKIDKDDNSIMFHIIGLSSKQDVMLRKILHSMVTLKQHINKEKFRIVKEELLDGMKNEDKEWPIQQVGNLRKHAIHEGRWSAQERLQSMGELSVESLRQYIDVFLRNIYVESLFCGNLLRSHVLDLFSIVEIILLRDNHARAMLPIQHLRPKEFEIPRGSNYMYEKRSEIHSFSALQIYHQVGLQSELNNVLCRLVHIMIGSPLFYALRTKEQLGYIVGSELTSSQSVQGITVSVQSDKEPIYVSERIDKFFETFKKTLQTMSEERFADYVEATAVYMLEKPTKLVDEAMKFGWELYTRQYHFRRAEKEVAILRKLKISDVIKFFEEYIDPKSEKRKRLATVVLGKNATALCHSKTTHWTRITDVLTFKSSMPLYQHIMPYNNVTLLTNKEVKLVDEME